MDHFPNELCRWGHSEWTGAWGDKSGEWADHPDVSNDLSPSGRFAVRSETADPDDGIFFMSFDDFALRFATEVECVRLPPLDLATRQIYFAVLQTRTYATVEFPRDYGSETLTHSRAMDVVKMITDGDEALGQLVEQRWKWAKIWRRYGMKAMFSEVMEDADVPAGHGADSDGGPLAPRIISHLESSGWNQNTAGHPFDPDLYDSNP